MFLLFEDNMKEKKMKETNAVVVGASVGVAVGIFLAICIFIFIRLYKKHFHFKDEASDHNIAALPIRMNGIGTSITSSVSVADSEIIHNLNHIEENKRGGHHDKDLSSSLSSIPRYFYKDIQKATQNFTTILGEGSFGPVYKAILPDGHLVAVKVLASNSRQGEREFQTEVLLLSRLHHRNLVNLVGYCVDKGQHMLVYEYMSNGSLARHLYGEGSQLFGWDERLQIALDVSHGIEYLHEGAVPPVIHRDLKPANILLDEVMRAKVADFGLSKEEEMYDGRKSGLKGTYGYMDPDYMTTSRFTKKSDIYSFGLIMFELITAISPHQGLTEYIDLAVMGEEGNADWDEILDKRLVGNCDLREVGLFADIAHRCLHKNPKKRPSIAQIILTISRIKQLQFTREESKIFPGRVASQVLERIQNQQIELHSITSRKENPSLRA